MHFSKALQDRCACEWVKHSLTSYHSSNTIVL